MDIENHIGLRLANISNLIKRLHHSMDDEQEHIPRMQTWVINYIRNRNSSSDMFQGELEQVFSITRATASNLLKRMERDGLIIRHPVSHDGRMKKITLTEKAISHSDVVRKRIEETERIMIEGLSQDEISTLLATLDKIQKNLE